MAVSNLPVLRARHDMLMRLLREHPEEARAVLLPAETAATLRSASPEIAALIEQDTSLEGELIATMADDFAHRTSRTNYILHSRTGDTDLYGQAIPTALLHRQVEAAGIVLDGVMAVDRVSMQALDLSMGLGGTIRDLAASQVTGAPPAVCSTTGDQKVAVLVLQFPSRQFVPSQDIPGMFNQFLFNTTPPSTTTFWNETSYGQASASGDVYGPIVMKNDYDCTTTSAMLTEALQIAASQVDYSKYNHVMLVFPASSCSFGGLGDIGCRGADSTFPTQHAFTWIPIGYPQTTPPDFGLVTSTSHELGHNLGLNHANSLDFGMQPLGPIDSPAVGSGTGGASTSTGRITAVDKEYGDTFDDMGFTYPVGPYNAQHRAQALGWLPSTNVQLLTSGTSTTTLLPVESTSGLRAMQVLRDPLTSSWIWLEYHQPITSYSSGIFANSASFGANNGNNMTTAVEVLYEDGYNQSGTGTRLLDMAPTGAATGNNFVDGALAAGKSWSDPYSLLTISTNSVGSSGAKVTVSYDTPCATVTLSADSLAAAASTGTATVTAPPSCSWTAFANAPWLTLTGAAGNGVVSGSGSGTITYAAPANPGLQRSTYLTIGRQSQPILQHATNTTAVNLSPSMTTIAPSQSQVFTLTMDDAAGLSDIHQVNLVFRGAYGNADCPVYVVFAGSTPIYYLSLGAGAVVVGGGSSNTGSTSLCSLSGAKSNLTQNGTRFTLTFDMGFTAAFAGAHAIQTSISSTVQSTTSLSMGTLVVNTAPSITMTPATGIPGNAVAAVIAGLDTNFSSSSVVTVSGSGVTVGTPTVTSGTSINVGLTIAASASLGQRTLTVTTGTEVVTTSFTVVPANATTTTLTLSATSVLPSAKPTLTTTVTSNGTPAPTGTVNFLDGTASLGTASLSSGTASLVAGPFAAGSHTLTAVYGGDTSNGGSTSAAVVLNSAQASSAVALKADSAAIFAGAAVNLTATATSVVPPTGTVTFLDGSSTVGTATLNSNGVAILSLPSLAVGSHSFTATYAATSDIATSTSSAVAVTVSDFTLSAVASSLTVNAGAASGNTFTLNVTPGTGGFATAITFACSGLPAASYCSFSPASVTPNTTAASTTMTIATTARSARAAAMGSMLILLLPISTLLRRARARRITLVLLVAACGLSLQGCQSGSNNSSGGSSTPTGTAAGSYTVTVTATATNGTSTLARTTNVTLVVN